MIRTKGEKVFGVFNIIFMVIFALVFIIPILFLFKTAFDMSPQTISLNLFPADPSLIFVKAVFRDNSIYKPFLNSIIITILGTSGAMAVNSMGAYTLSRRDLPGVSSMVYFMIVIPMFVSGGMVPSYLIMKTLGWTNTLTVLIVPGMVSGFNMIIIRNYYWTVPKSLLEAARIDGAGEFTTFVRIILPLSKPVLAAIALFTGVGYWQTFMSAVIYVSDSSKQPFSVKLRELIMTQQEYTSQFDELLREMNKQSSYAGASLNQDGIASVIILFSMVPILVAYPWLQKYFAAGMLRGSIKG